MWSKFASTRDLGSLLKQRQIPRALGSETQTLQADVITFAWLLARGKHPQTGSIAKPFCRSSPRPSFCTTFAKRTWVAQDRSVPSPIRAGVESCSERSQQGDSVPAGGGSYPRIPGRKATYPVVTGFFYRILIFVTLVKRISGTFHVRLNCDIRTCMAVEFPLLTNGSLHHQQQYVASCLELLVAM